ncbi:MAG TPA: integrase [Pseudonocardiaceae bacterium]|jgi:integrase|nr:integrase [Pseudonocardiaceae bacterium]
MRTSTDVAIWKTEVYKGERKTTYYVRWRVEKQPFREPRSTTALANSFRSQLVTAASKGEAFALESGLPVSMHRAKIDLTWYESAQRYADAKWDALAGNSRRNTAYSLSIATLAMCKTDRGKPSDIVLNKALAGWAFNKLQRARKIPDAQLVDALEWLATNTRPVSDLAEPEYMRTVLDRLTRNANGSPAAPDTVARRRGVVYNAIGRWVAQGIFDKHPMDGIDWTAPKVDNEVDKRCVANPTQVRTLLRAVRVQGRKGPRIPQTGPRHVAFFGCLYYAGLRPEEAANLRERNLALPEEGWGTIILEGSAPVVGQQWADIAGRREERSLKHRSKKATRPVPCHPELTGLLREHLAAFGTTEDGRLFRATNGGELGESTYHRIWRQARAATFTPDVFASPLARVPYDLRHACVSTWLNGGVEATQVAEWAGHSVAVLLRIYAKCVDGRDEVNRRRIEEALGG